MKTKCEKVGHKSRKACEREMMSMEQNTGRVFNSYRCERCGKWHIGSALKLVDPHIHQMFPKQNGTVPDGAAEYQRGWIDGVNHGLSFVKNCEDQK